MLSFDVCVGQQLDDAAHQLAEQAQQQQATQRRMVAALCKY